MADAILPRRDQRCQPMVLGSEQGSELPLADDTAHALPNTSGATSAFLQPLEQPADIQHLWATLEAPDSDLKVREGGLHMSKTVAPRGGIVPGGGVALLRAKSVLTALTGANADVTAGISIVLRALEAPIRQIAENSGVEGSIVVGKLMDAKDPNQGFNAQTELYVDMIKAGIVDPAKVVRTALQDAGSIAALLITAEAMIADIPQKDTPAMGSAGGMGGMGY